MQPVARRIPLTSAAVVEDIDVDVAQRLGPCSGRHEHLVGDRLAVKDDVEVDAPAIIDP
jgi:hypothetical protein